MKTPHLSPYDAENLANLAAMLRARRPIIRAMEERLKAANQPQAAAFLGDMASEISLGLLAINGLVKRCQAAAPHAYPQQQEAGK